MSLLGPKQSSAIGTFPMETAPYCGLVCPVAPVAHVRSFCFNEMNSGSSMFSEKAVLGAARHLPPRR
jgi:hypothetical protein